MISRYLRKRTRGDRVAIFHQLHPDPVYCSEGEWQRLLESEASVPELQSKLTERGLILSSPDEDDAELRRASDRLLSKHSSATGLYLMTAQSCNMNCGYCMVPEYARVHGESLLSEDAAFAGIDLWFEHLKDRGSGSECVVIFYGGEPLLNKEVIWASLRYIAASRHEGKPERLSFLIVTNGTLVDQTVVEMCRKHGVMVAVSLDGAKATNDSVRVDTGGEGTYHAAVRAIQALVAGQVRTFGSVTIGTHNIGSLGETARLLEGLGVEKFGFNFIKGKRLFEFGGREGERRYHGSAALAALESRGKPGFEYQWEKKSEAFSRHDFFPHDCTCYGSQLVIQPDGQLSNCPFTKTRMGDVRTVDKGFRIWNQPIVHEWRQRLPLFDPRLKESDELALCGPGCAWSSQELFGSLLATDETNHAYAKGAFDELIWSKA